MQTVDEKPETIHLYVVRETAQHLSLLPIVLTALALLLVVAVSVVVPSEQPVTRVSIRVPAVLLPIRTFTATVAVIPTGVRVYPATTAHGVLTITNGSVIAQTIPQGFRLGNVATDWPVFVPGGDANGYGWAQVEAHAVATGQNGNLPPYTINSVIGSSVYVRNLSAFSGGRNRYSVKYATVQDIHEAVVKARQQVNSASTGLHYPCVESVMASVLSWRCQFITYSLPSYMHVSSVRIIGKNLVIAVTFTPHPVRVGLK